MGLTAFRQRRSSPVWSLSGAALTAIKSRKVSWSHNLSPDQTVRCAVSSNSLTFCMYVAHMKTLHGRALWAWRVRVKVLRIENKLFMNNNLNMIGVFVSELFG